MESFRTVGTCARQILFDVDENNVLQDVKFLGGCAGGLQALSKLTCGKKIEEIIEICEGIQCKNGTSCPDQFAKALREYIKRKENEKLGIEPARRGHPPVFRVNIQVIKVVNPKEE